jgi:uncharacterized protein (TIGR02246 family)
MKKHRILALVFLAAVGIVLAHHARSQLPAQEGPAQDGVKASPAHGAPGDADREAIMKGARTFADAFNKGDAKAIAGMWTENGESREAGGRTFVGRAAIEKAYAAFFKANPSAKLEVLVKSVRAPAKDLAVEEGLLRHSRGPKDLPATTAYVAVHVREGSVWKIALASEGPVGQDRLEDLDWLLGEWTTKVKEDAVKLSFARDPKKPAITGTFTRTPPGKDALSGSIRVALDPETGQIRSWSFEDDGGHSQSLWACDGKSWILDTRGVLADGTPTAERIVLQRVGPDVITWRAIDRLVGDAQLTDSPPMRLTRTAARK